MPIPGFPYNLFLASLVTSFMGEYLHRARTAPTVRLIP